MWRFLSRLQIQRSNFSFRIVNNLLACHLVSAKSHRKCPGLCHHVLCQDANCASIRLFSHSPSGCETVQFGETSGSLSADSDSDSHSFLSLFCLVCLEFVVGWFVILRRSLLRLFCSLEEKWDYIIKSFISSTRQSVFFFPSPDPPVDC